MMICHFSSFFYSGKDAVQIRAAFFFKIYCNYLKYFFNLANVNNEDMAILNKFQTKLMASKANALYQVEVANGDLALSFDFDNIDEALQFQSAIADYDSVLDFIADFENIYN